MTEATRPSRSTLLATASAVIAGYNSWSVDAILAPRSPTCIHLILPRTLHIPPMNNAQYASYFAASIPNFRNFQVTVDETVVDEEARKVVMFASSNADTDLGTYANEYVLQVETGQDGRGAERVIEWVDSGYSTQFMKKLEKEIEKKQENGKGTGGGQPNL